MVDINDDSARVRGRMEIRTGVIRRRQWTDEEKGRLVAEAVAPGAVIAEVARRHDLTPQHLSNWIRAAKEGHFALPADEAPAFVPVVVETEAPKKTAPCERSCAIVIMIGDVRVRVPGGAEACTVEAVLRAVRRVLA
jgi:transposase